MTYPDYLPDLDHAVDATLVATRSLTRVELVRAIEIRRRQIEHDRHAMREWQQALAQADRFWTRHPDWSFGQCLDAILAAAHRNAGRSEVLS